MFSRKWNTCDLCQTKRKQKEAQKMEDGYEYLSLKDRQEYKNETNK